MKILLIVLVCTCVCCEGQKNCGWDVPKYKYCPLYDTEAWRCLARNKNCHVDTLYHCGRAYGNETVFVEACAVKKDCGKGREPWLEIREHNHDMVYCELCFGKRYNDAENTDSSTFSLCPEEQPIYTKDNHLLSCNYVTEELDLKEKRQWSRCDATQNYRFRSLNYDLKGCSNEKTGCIFIGPCPEGKERLQNYTCSDICVDGHRDSISEVCIQVPVPPNTKPGSTSTTSVTVIPVTKETTTTDRPISSTKKTETTDGAQNGANTSNTTVIVGLSIGGICVVLLVVLIILKCCWYQKKHDNSSARENIDIEAHNETDELLTGEDRQTNVKQTNTADVMYVVRGESITFNVQDNVKGKNAETDPERSLSEQEEEHSSDRVEVRYIKDKKSLTDKQRREIYRKALKSQSKLLIRDMDPESLLDSIEEEDIYDDTTIRDIRDITVKSKKNREVFYLVKRNGWKKYDTFKKCLFETKQDHLIEALQKAEDTAMSNIISHKHTDKDESDDEKGTDDDNGDGHSYECNPGAGEGDGDESNLDNDETGNGRNAGDGDGHGGESNLDNDENGNRRNPEAGEGGGHGGESKHDSDENSYGRDPEYDKSKLSDGEGYNRTYFKYTEGDKEGSDSKDCLKETVNELKPKEKAAMQILEAVARKADWDSFVEELDTLMNTSGDILEFTKSQVDIKDMRSAYYIKNCPTGFKAYHTSGDNNCCLYQSISKLLVGTEQYQIRLRLAAVVHAATHVMLYVKHLKLSFDQNLREDILQYFKTHVTERSYKKHENISDHQVLIETFVKALVMETAISNMDSSQVQVQFLSDAMNRRIKQYFQTNTDYGREREIVPLLEDLVSKEPFHIMWVNDKDNLSQPLNHIVPLLKSS